MMKRIVTVISLFIILLGTTPSYDSFVQAKEPSIKDCLEDEGECREKKGEQQPEEVAETKNSITFWTYVKLLLAFAFVIALLYGLLRFINQRNQQMTKHKLMKNLGGVPLGQNKSVQLVVIGDQYLLLGVGETVQLLKEITDEEEKERLRRLVEDGQLYQAEQGTLIDYIKDLFQQKKKKKEQSSEANFQQLFEKELENTKRKRQKKMNEVVEKEREKDE